MPTGRPPSGTAPPVRVRPVANGDGEAWLRMRGALWPDARGDHAAEVAAFLDGNVRAVFPGGTGAVLLATVGGLPAGFLEVGTRAWAEGCGTTPVGFLEGVWVEPAFRRRGVARCLVEAGEAWARALGCVEMASDAELEDTLSQTWHAALGYAVVERQVCFRRELS